MTTLEAWILSAALHFAPPEKHRAFPGHEESIEDARERYGAIAHDIAEAVADRKDAKNAAALALAWAIGESGLYHDADVGPCHREGAYRLRCDGGRAAGIWQLHEYRDRETKTWVGVDEIFADRARSAKLVVRLQRGAWTMCRGLPVEDRLSGFGLGTCVIGNASVRARYALWKRVSSWSPPAR